MSRIVCEQCGGTVGPAPPVPGRAVLCSRCARAVEMPPLAGGAADPWSNSLTEWEAAIANDPKVLVSPPPGPEAAIPLDRFRVVIYSLLGLMAFLIALIGVVLAARQLRPLVAGSTPEQTKLRHWIHEMELASNSKESRLEAARKIVAMGPDAVMAALDDSTSAGADSETLSIIQPAAHALTDVGPDAVDALSRALASPKANVRAGAANVLREMGSQGKRATAALVRVLGDENRWVRWYAAEALGNMGADAAPAVDALLPLLDHKDAYTRRHAIEALGRIGVPAKRAIPALTRARDDDHDISVRTAARVALHQVNLVELAAQALQQANGEVRELIGKLQGDDESAAAAAAKTLGELGARAGDAVPALALALRHKSKRIRAAAATALGNLDGAAHDVLPALQAAAKDAQPEVRAAAQKAIAQIEGN